MGQLISANDVADAVAGQWNWPTPRGPNNTDANRKKGKKRKPKKTNSPPYQILSLPTQMHIVRDDKIMRPIDNLLVRLVRGLRTKGRVPNQTLKRDGAQRPPVALAPIPLLQENLGCDIIWSSNGGIGLCGKTTEHPVRIND